MGPAGHVSESRREAGPEQSVLARRSLASGKRDDPREGIWRRGPEGRDGGGTCSLGWGRHVLPRFGEHCCSLTTPCHPGSSQPGAGVLRREQAEARRLGRRGRTCGGQGRGFHSDPHARRRSQPAPRPPQTLASPRKPCITRGRRRRAPSEHPGNHFRCPSPELATLQSLLFSPCRCLDRLLISLYIFSGEAALG